MKKELSYEDIRKMRKGTNAFDQYPFPFLKDVSISIRVLTQNEILECLDEGRTLAKEHLKDPRDIDIYQIGMARLIQQAVYVTPEDKKETPKTHFFGSVEEVLELSVEETRMLEEYYNAVQEKYSPMETLKEPKDFLNLIEAIKKNKIDGNYLSSLTLRRLVSYLIENSETSQNDNGTGSTPWTYSNEKKKISLEDLEVQLESTTNDWMEI